MRSIQLKPNESVTITTGRTSIKVTRSCFALIIESEYIHAQVQGTDYVHVFGGVKKIVLNQGLGDD